MIETQTIKILLVDDHDILRGGLAAVLNNEPDMEVIAEANEGRSALDMVRQHNPDVIVMDVTMPHLNGIDATTQICKAAPDMKVLALSMHGESKFVSRMLEAGAKGYLTKSCTPEELVSAVRTVHKGKVYLSPKIATVVIQDYVAPEKVAPGPSLEKLSSREREVLQLFAEGKTTKQIAMLMHLSPKTIETHRAHIMEKLGIHSIAELTKFSLREGLTSLDH
ncbi:MAG: response regulator transcription factor [Phycisphaerae bacterium]|nr:response regulator transcription factor [Phycisphaerae bacterium]